MLMIEKVFVQRQLHKVECVKVLKVCIVQVKQDLQMIKENFIY